MSDKRELRVLKDHSCYLHSYAGVTDLANGFDANANFESHLKFQALFHEKIIVPDGFFYMPGPIVESLRRMVARGADWQENVALRMMKSGVLVPALRRGDSLRDNWIEEACGIRHDWCGYPSKADGLKILDLVEPNIVSYSQWPKTMAKAMKPAYSLELKSLFLGIDGRDASIGCAEIGYYLKLAGFPSRGWHSLFESFRNAIEGMLQGREFRRAGLEQAIVDHFQIKFSDVYQFVSAGTKRRKDSRWPEYAVADLLLRISSTIYEAYHAHQLNAVGNLFPGYIQSLVNADTYSRVVHLSGGRPHAGGPIVPGTLLDCRRISTEAIDQFRQSPIFDQYCKMLAELKAGEPSQSFVDVNGQFYAFLRETYLPAVIEAFPQAIGEKRMKNAGDALQVGSWLVASQHLPSLFTQTSVFGLTLFATVGVVGSKISDRAAEVAEVVSKMEKSVLRRRSRKNLNGFIAMEQTAASKVREASKARTQEEMLTQLSTVPERKRKAGVR